MLTSISCVLVIEGDCADKERLAAFSNELSKIAESSELIVVANGLSDSDYLALKLVVGELPDCTCLVLGDYVDTDLAQLLGLENAISDYVVLSAPDEKLAKLLPKLAPEFRSGYDIVVCKQQGMKASHSRGVLERTGYWILSLLTGLNIDGQPLLFCGLSREAAQHILAKPEAQLLLKAGSAGKGFPVRVLPDNVGPVRPKTRRSAGDRLGKALRLLVSVGAAPVRVVSIVTLTTSVLAILYALYVVYIYLTKPNIQSGWTTLSLQLSGMMFLFSLALALLSEYVVQIYTATAGRRGRHVVREIRSQRTAREGRLNIIDAEGRYKLGAPSQSTSGEV